MQSIFLANDHSLQIQKNGIDTLNGVCINGNMPAKILLSGQGWEKEVLSYWSLNPSLTFAQLSTMNEIIKAIKYGSGVTLTSVVAKLSTVAGTAFISNPTFTYTGLPSNDLSWLDGSGWKVNFNDGSKNAYLYAKAKGTGETYNYTVTGDTNNGNMETGDPPTGWMDTGGSSTASSVADERTGGTGSKSINIARGTTSSCRFRASGASAGQLLVFGGWIKNIDATNAFISLSNAAFIRSATSWENGESKYTATAAHFLALNITGAPGQQVRFDDVYAGQQLTPSASGLTGTSTALGATYNWASIESGFDPNVASFSVTITRA